MARTKKSTTTRKKHKKVLNAAKGYRGHNSNLYRKAKEKVERGRKHAYRHRREKKREFRELWITRINAAARREGTTYSQLMGGLRKAGVELNRKMLADIAVRDPDTFAELVDVAEDAM
jgi:large subunit ribosomal protein L20